MPGKRLLAISSVSAAVFAAFGVTAAQAAPAAPVTASTAESAGHSAGVPATSLAGVKARADAYWTPARLKAATPVDVRIDAKAAAKLAGATPSKGTAGRVSPSGKPAPALTPKLAAFGSTAADWYGSTTAPPATTSGKVFFTDAAGVPKVCSGSTVNSAGKDVVFTAGHCVVQGGAALWYNAQPWIFIPGYQNGAEPYGRWYAAQLFSLNGWINSGDRTHDIGAAVMFTNSWGTHIVDAVGGQGIEWNWPLEQYQYQFGYPQRAPFNGQTLKYCSNTTYNDGGHQGINCNMTEGASGGPWLDDFGGTFGWLDSVNSWVFWDGNGVRYKWNGPYFGNNAMNLFNAVANL